MISFRALLKIALSASLVLAWLCFGSELKCWAQGISRIGRPQTLIGSGYKLALPSPCVAGGRGCTSGHSAPAGTVLVACMWNFFRGYAATPPTTCPTNVADVPLPMTPPKGWVQVDHFEEAYTMGYNTSYGV